MQRFITDERTGIRYELIGDYYYPCLTVEESHPLSKYGRLRQRYLREHKRVLYFNLLTSGKLYEHLAEVSISARCSYNFPLVSRLKYSTLLDKFLQITTNFFTRNEKNDTA